MRVVVDALSVEHVRGQQRTRALDTVSTTFQSGEAVAVMGRSGSGKSTLALALKRLVPISSGNVSYLLPPGVDPRRAIAVVLQRPESAVFAETVEQDVRFAAEIAGVDRHEQERRVQMAMSATGLDPSYRRRDPFSLSGGERRRVAIAGALTLQPRLLVLDEPSAGLDAPSRRQLRLTIGGLVSAGIGIVLVTHDMEEAAATCTRLVVLDAGRMAFDGPLLDVATDPSRCMALGLPVHPHAQLVQQIAHDSGRAAPRALDDTAVAHYVAAVVGDGARR